jgi:hypothetical protein
MVNIFVSYAIQGFQLNNRHKIDPASLEALSLNIGMITRNNHIMIALSCNRPTGLLIFKCKTLLILRVLNHE